VCRLLGSEATDVAVSERIVAGLRLRVYVDGEPAALLGAVVGVLGARGAAVTDLSLGEPTLEDVFIHLTGRDLR